MPFPLAAGAAAAVGIAGTVLSGLSLAAETLNKISPQLEDEVTVEVVGQPGATKQELYFLALAAANGMVRRFNRPAGLNSLVFPAFGAIMIEYDAADHWVRATIRYRWSTIAAAAGSSTLPRPGNFFDNLAVYRGPQCNVVGDNFDFVSPLLPGIPASSVDPAQAPILPFDNQMILTGCPTTRRPTPAPITQPPAPDAPLAGGAGVEIPSPNPKPPGDNRSRGAVVRPGSGGESTAVTGSAGTGDKIKCCPKTLELIPLVYAALSDPATFADMNFVGPTPGPEGG